MKPSTPAPVSPVSRKLRSDSKLSTLSPGIQSLLLQKLESQSYQETASWLQNSHGISVSPSNLSTFRSRYLENQALKEAYLQSATFYCTLQELQQQEIDPGDAQVEAAVRRLFLFKVVHQGDIGTYLHFTRVGNESKKLALTQARQARLQQERRDAKCDSEAQDLFTSIDLPSSPRHYPSSALNPNPGPCAPPAQPPIGVGTSRPHTMPLDSTPSETAHPNSCPKAPGIDSTSPSCEAPIPPAPAPPLARPEDLLDSFMQALDAVMPMDGAEPVSPSHLDPFYATIIATVIGRMLDLIQAGKFPPASRSPSHVPTAQPAPVPIPASEQSSAASIPSPGSDIHSKPLPPMTSPVSESEKISDSSPSSQSSSPSNSLKYPKTPLIRSTAFFLPDRPAPCPDSADTTKDSASNPPNEL